MSSPDCLSTLARTVPAQISPTPVRTPANATNDSVTIKINPPIIHTVWYLSVTSQLHKAISGQQCLDKSAEYGLQNKSRSYKTLQIHVDVSFDGKDVN